MGKNSDKNSVDVKEIIKDIKKKAHGDSFNEEIPGFDKVSDEREKKIQEQLKEEELEVDLLTLNQEYFASYDKSVDIGSPIRAKLGSMIRVRVNPVIEKRNNWCASVARLFNQLSGEVKRIKGVVDESDPQLLRIQIDELELKLHMAMKQIEVMNSRITELETEYEKRK